MALCTITGKIRDFFQIPRWGSLIITIISILLISSISIVIIIPQFTSEFQELINQIPSAVRKLWELCINTFLSFAEIVYKDNIPNLTDKTTCDTHLKIIINPVQDEWLNHSMGLHDN